MQHLEFSQIAASIAGQWQAQTWLDWFITITALVYIALAARENAWCWLWGMVSCSVWAYADFVRYNLWVDGILQIFYVGMGAWGLYSWKFGKTSEDKLPIRVLRLRGHLLIWTFGVILSLVLGYVFSKYTPTALPYPDSVVTAFSLIATILTVRKILENWLYWILFDAMAVFLFLVRDAFLVALIMVIYTIIAILGYFRWRKQWKEDRLVASFGDSLPSIF